MRCVLAMSRRLIVAGFHSPRTTSASAMHREHRNILRLLAVITQLHAAAAFVCLASVAVRLQLLSVFRSCIQCVFAMSRARVGVCVCVCCVALCCTFMHIHTYGGTSWQSGKVERNGSVLELLARRHQLKNDLRTIDRQLSAVSPVPRERSELTKLSH